MNKYHYLALLLVVLVLTGCATSEPVATSPTSYEDIDVEILDAMMKERRESFFLPDTDLSIAYDKITENLHLLPEDKNAEIVLYCRNDPMSRAAASDLVSAGYTNVKNLVGGFNAWKAAGFPMEMAP